MRTYRGEFEALQPALMSAAYYTVSVDFLQARLYCPSCFVVCAQVLGLTAVSIYNVLLNIMGFAGSLPELK